MKELFAKIGMLIAAIVAAIAMFSRKSKVDTHEEEHEKLDAKIEADKVEVEKIEEKLEKIEKDGVEDKSMQEELDYWKNNK